MKTFSIALKLMKNIEASYMNNLVMPVAHSDYISLYEKFRAKYFFTSYMKDVLGDVCTIDMAIKSIISILGDTIWSLRKLKGEVYEALRDVL